MLDLYELHNILASVFVWFVDSENTDKWNSNICEMRQNHIAVLYNKNRADNLFREEISTIMSLLMKLHDRCIYFKSETEN